VDLTPRFLPVENSDQPHVLARHVAAAVERALIGESDPDRRLELVNDLLDRVAAQDDQLATAVQHLVELTPRGGARSAPAGAAGHASRVRRQQQPLLAHDHVPRLLPSARSSSTGESQNSTSVASEPGQRYLHHRERGTHVALFVREAPTDDLGAAPFLCLGLCDYVEHQGERPITVTWRLRRRMPGETFRVASAVAS
jgi:hypothetical protein